MCNWPENISAVTVMEKSLMHKNLFVHIMSFIYFRLAVETTAMFWQTHICVLVSLKCQTDHNMSPQKDNTLRYSLGFIRFFLFYLKQLHSHFTAAQFTEAYYGH